jgi:hypothetical protein
MNWRSFTSTFIASCFLLIAARSVAHDPTEDECGAASSDVSLELAVMRSPAISVTAVPGKDSPVPELALDKHYAINLIPQGDLAFRVKPGRASRSELSRGGILRFTVPAAARYRISITSQHWIDVIDGRSVVASAAHHGPDCELLHKIVEFDLPAGRPLTLQLSGRDDAIVGLAITLSPSAAKQDPT